MFDQTSSKRIRHEKTITININFFVFHIPMLACSNDILVVVAVVVTVVFVMAIYLKTTTSPTTSAPILTDPTTI